MENKRIYIGGDFNASVGVNGEPMDKLGAKLEETLMCEAGLDMLVDQPTHQEVKNGVPCNARTIDHIYTNGSEKTSRTRVVSEPGSHNKLLIIKILGKVVKKTPLQHKARQRKNYNADDFLQDLDVKDWSIPESNSNDGKKGENIEVEIFSRYVD